MSNLGEATKPVAFGPENKSPFCKSPSLRQGKKVFRGASSIGRDIPERSAKQISMLNASIIAPRRWGKFSRPPYAAPAALFFKFIFFITCLSPCRASGAILGISNRLQHRPKITQVATKIAQIAKQDRPKPAQRSPKLPPRSPQDRPFLEPSQRL